MKAIPMMMATVERLLKREDHQVMEMYSCIKGKAWHFVAWRKPADDTYTVRCSSVGIYLVREDETIKYRVNANQMEYIDFIDVNE